MRIFVSFVTQQQFYFRGHLKLIVGLPGDSLQSACVHVYMLCVLMYVLVNKGEGIQ